MEILAPAGNYSQALVSIENGCNALYGGLKKWSARSRAVNLSEEEYASLIKKCDDNNIKFYLTINTLLSDDELQEIDEFLSNGELPSPHGILVGDLGLLNLLKSKYNHIPIHISTQFGAYSLRDITLCQSLGAERVVLARELTLDEIKRIRKSTDVELEVFVYGNQCVITSGNCLWGGLSHTGSGHKGCCVGSCNDLFLCQNNRIGNFLWSNNIGLYGYVKTLEALGVDSIKIEGRLRSNEEIKSVLGKLEKSLEGKYIANDYGYSGYFAGAIPPEGIINDYNPENKYQIIENMIFTENDYMMSDNSGCRRFELGSRHNSAKYVYTMFNKEIKNNKTNISLRLNFSCDIGKKSLESISYTRQNGTRVVFDMKSKETNKTTIYLFQIIEILNTKIKENIYECKAKIPSMSKVRVDLKKLDDMILQINDSLNKIQYKVNLYEKDRTLNKENTIISVDSVEDINLGIAYGYKKFIFIIKKETLLVECLKFEEKNNDIDIYYQIPYLDYANNFDSMLIFLKNKKVVITRISQISLQQKYHFADMIGDISLNIWNSESARWYKENGISMVIAHPELSMSRLRDVQNKSGLKMIIIAASKIPYGYTRMCVRGQDLCNENCTNETVCFHDINKGHDVEFICDNQFGYRTICNADYYVASSWQTDDFILLGLSGMKKEEKKLLLLGSVSQNDKERIYIDE